MAREPASERADRLLVAGNVQLLEVGRHGLVARVRGRSGIYLVRHFARWTCTCPHPNHTTSCSHVLACKRVTVPDLKEHQ